MDPFSRRDRRGHRVVAQMRYILITWDEAYNGSGQPVSGGVGDPPTDGGPILLYLLSRSFYKARPASSVWAETPTGTIPLTHGGLLRSIEQDTAGLPFLGDAGNTTYGDIGDVLISRGIKPGSLIFDLCPRRTSSPSSAE